MATLTGTVFHNSSDFVGQLLIYSLLWLILADGTGWAFGFPTALCATLVAIRLGLQPFRRLRLLQLPSMTVFLLRTMMSGAWDVTVRVLHYRDISDPAWTRYTLTVSDPFVRRLTSLIVCLLPGTLASQIVGDQLSMHVLDQQRPWEASVAELERRLANLFAVQGA